MPPWQEAPNLQSPEQGPPVVCAAQDLLGLVNLRRTQSRSRFSDLWVGLGFGSRFFYGQAHTKNTVPHCKSASACLVGTQRDESLLLVWTDKGR